MKTINPLGIALAPTPKEWDSHSVAAPIVWADDSSYYMLYQGWNKGSGPRLLGLATSRDGLHWERNKTNPVMVPGSNWEKQGFECGCLLQREGKFWLYYTGMSEKTRIGLATSSDLQNWHRYSQNPILDVGDEDAWDGNGVAFPAVVRRPGGWMMMYGGYGKQSMQLGLAYSKDGKLWEKYAHNPNFTQRSWFDNSNCYAWDAGIEAHQVFTVGDWYVMFYEGLGKAGNYNIGVAYSPDGEIWARSPNNPLLGLTDSTVTYDRSTVHPYLLRQEMRLYYVEVLHASTQAVHRICAAQIDPSVINPLAQQSLTFPLWIHRRILGKEATTNILPCQGFRNKTFFLVSDSTVSISIEIDPGGFEDWYEYHHVNVKPNKLWVFNTHDDFCRTRISVQQTQRAIVSAWVTLAGH